MDKFKFSFNLRQQLHRSKIPKKIVKKNHKTNSTSFASPRDAILSLEYFQQVYTDYLFDQLVNPNFTRRNNGYYYTFYENKFY